MTDILPTQNEAWGFFGTMARADHDPMQAWNVASAMIAADTGADQACYGAEGVRGFLDSRDGRHFADMVMMWMGQGDTLEEAVDRAIGQYQLWRITSRMEREHGIPAGLPYLTGWAQHYAIEAEEALTAT
jgi:hypothetical protein